MVGDYWIDLSIEIEDSKEACSKSFTSHPAGNPSSLVKPPEVESRPLSSAPTWHSYPTVEPVSVPHPSLSLVQHVTSASLQPISPANINPLSISVTVVVPPFEPYPTTPTLSEPNHQSTLPSGIRLSPSAVVTPSAVVSCPNLLFGSHASPSHVRRVRCSLRVSQLQPKVLTNRASSSCLSRPG